MVQTGGCGMRSFSKLYDEHPNTRKQQIINSGCKDSHVNEVWFFDHTDVYFELERQDYYQFTPNIFRKEALQISAYTFTNR